MEYNNTDWNVADNCVLLYLPTDNISVQLKVEGQNNVEYVKIFSTNSTKTDTDYDFYE